MLKEAYTRRLFLKRVVKTLEGIILPTILLDIQNLTLPYLWDKDREGGIGNQASPSITSIGRRFDGEELKYRIGFWWFKDAATGRISFKKKGDGGYIATVEAETLGLIGLLTRYRRDIYYAHMEEIDGGRRLRTYLFEKVVTIGDKVRRGYIKLDYAKMVMEWKSYGGGSPEKGAIEPIPYGTIYDDPIVAFYNFRYGSYGKLEKGKEFIISTFPKDGRPSNISLRIAPEEEKERRLAMYRERERIEYLIDLKLDGELIDSRTGEIEIHMTEGLLPLYGVVKDVFFFGDVRGRLVED